MEDHRREDNERRRRRRRRPRRRRRSGQLARCLLPPSLSLSRPAKRSMKSPSSIISITIIVLLFIIDLSSSRALATIGDQCDHDKYTTGCYSRANLYCDRATNQCVCLPETPVLIEKKFCVERAKENETCQYNEQCDNDNGLYCSYSDHKLLNNCLPVGLRCRCIRLAANLKQHNSQKQHLSYPFGSSSSSSSQQHHHKQSRSQHNQLSSQQPNQNPLPNGGSSLPRLVWIFLLVCLFVLMFLLLMLKSEFYRLRRSPRQEDRISINSEADVPPPYEVAIRMKL